MQNTIKFKSNSVFIRLCNCQYMGAFGDDYVGAFGSRKIHPMTVQHD